MRLVVTIAFASVVIGTILFFGVHDPSTTDAASAIPKIASEHGGFSVALRPDKPPAIRFDWDDPESSQAYYDANEKRIQQLINQPAAHDDPINVTLTFNKPVPWEEFVALRDKVGLQPSTLTFAERGPNGEKWALDVLRILPDDELVPYVENEASYANTTVLGVILVEASITPAPATLGVLASDPRVFAVDTVRVEAAQLLTQRGGESSTVDPSQIWVPSPYWNFDWP